MLFGKKKPLVLVVDDERPYVELMLNLIQSYGYEGLGVLSSVEAVAKAAELKPAVLLLDIMMPEQDGLETLTQLKRNEKTRGIPVLMISSKQTGKDIETAFELGAVGYIIKPVQPPILKRRLEEILSPDAKGKA